jgi:tetratricopeptide (TPR) repeat protein
MADRPPNADTPASDEVLAALDGIVSSAVFRGSPQLAAFLSYVVNSTLGGKSDSIKGYTIGVEALKRDKNFDPQIDPIVRVEATRLRRALERYYATEGAATPVRIELVRGTYTPQFSYWTTLRVAAAPNTAPATTPLSAGNGMPTLAIHPFKMLNESLRKSISNTVLHEKLCDAFARFDTINIKSADGDRDDTPADYRLIGSIEYRGGNTHVRCRLLDATDNLVAWSRIFERPASADGPAADEDAIVIELAVTLMQPFGVVRARERVRHLANGGGDPRYRAIVEASESFRSFDPAQHVQARDHLEELVSADPSFAYGYTYLAGLYIREYQYRYPGSKSDSVLLDTAVQMAQRSIELKPESSRAYQIFSAVLFARQEITAAFAAADKAIALNKYDTTILSDYGGRLIAVGEITRGMEMLGRAAQFGTVRPSWYHFYLFLGGYLTGDLITTVHHASRITSNDYTLGLVAHILAAKIAGDQGRRNRAIARLTAIDPAWGTNPRGELARFFPVPELADRLAAGLAQAGLPGTRPGTISD